MCVKYISVVGGRVPERSGLGDAPANLRTTFIPFPHDNCTISSGVYLLTLKIIPEKGLQYVVSVGRLRQRCSL